MNIIICLDGDGIGQLVGRMAMTDDVEGLRRISQKIQQGNEVFTRWANSIGGNVISSGGDEAILEVSIDHIEDLPVIAKEYQDLTSHTVSIGVGMRLSEAEKSLLAAKVRGKDRIVFFDPSVEEDLISAEEAEQDEKRKISKEYLTKADQPTDEQFRNKERRDSNIGMRSQNKPEQAQGPESVQDEHSQGETAREAWGQAASPEATDAAEQFNRTHLARDLEMQFHDFAMQQEQADGKARDNEEKTKQKESDKSDIEKRIVAILKEVKDQADTLHELEEENPDLYQTIVDAVQAMVLMAKELKDDKETDDPENTQKRELQPDKPLPSPKILDKVKKQEDTNKRKYRQFAVGTLNGPSPSVGDMKNTGKLKVQDQDGHTHWVEARSGLVLGPNSNHAVSSRKPNIT